MSGRGRRDDVVIRTRNFTSRWLQRVNIVAGLAALACNVALDLCPIPRQGIVGAAIATAISYAGACAILAWAFLRETGMSPFDVFRAAAG